MYALAQCWMQQGILGSFRQGRGALTADQQQQGAGELDLSPWFDSLLVRLVILVSKERLCERPATCGMCVHVHTATAIDLGSLCRT